MRAAERSLRERLAPPVLTVPRCTTYYIDRPRQDDAQFYGSAGGSGIFLYASPDDDKPYAILEFGPRGVVRQTTLPDSVDDFLAHMATRDPQDLEADRAAAWARSPE